MNTTTTISIMLRHLIRALEAIQRDVSDAERDMAAEFLGLSKATLYKLTMTREIPFIKLSCRTMFSEERLLTWVKAREHTPDDLSPNAAS